MDSAMALMNGAIGWRAAINRSSYPTGGGWRDRLESRDQSAALRVNLAIGPQWFAIRQYSDSPAHRICVAVQRECIRHISEF
jgi:hypothetical protein